MGRRESKYCEKCGCYLPEGETVCVSCGYDPTPKPARAMNQTNCSTTQAVEAFAQLAQDHRDAWKQVMLHDALWAKGGKGNPRTVVTPNCIKGHMDSSCTRYCDCCYLEKEDKDKYTHNIIRIYRCKKYPHRSYIGTIN